MQSAAQAETLAEGSLYTSCVEPTAKVEVFVTAQRSPDDETEGSLYTSCVEPTVKSNGHAETGTESSLYTSCVEPTAKVIAGSRTSSLHASSVLAAAADRSAASRTNEDPFEKDHWVLDVGTNYDTCPEHII